MRKVGSCCRSTGDWRTPCWGLEIEWGRRGEINTITHSTIEEVPKQIPFRVYTGMQFYGLCTHHECVNIWIICASYCYLHACK